MERRQRYASLEASRGPRTPRAAPRRPLSAPPGAAAEILRLQRLAGNQAVSAWLSAPPVRTVQRMTEDPELDSPRFANDQELTDVRAGRAVLGSGRSGEAVRKVQQLLRDLGIVRSPLTVSGSFDAATKMAVETFQAEQDLARRDGVVDDETMKSLNLRGRMYAGPDATIDPGAADPEIGSSGVTVTLPERIRAASTPPTMSESRIPPRVDTPVRVDISGLTEGSPPVTIAVAAETDDSGSVTVDGRASVDVRGTSVVRLRGVNQSDPGGGLELVARQDGEVIASSRPFSVSAIPQFCTTAYEGDIRNERLGFGATDGWESDSGDLADLGDVRIREEIEVTVASGCFEGVQTEPSGYRLGTVFETDRHAVPFSMLTKPGQMVVQQTHTFKDKRTESENNVMRGSGYEIARACAIDEKGGVLTVIKEPKVTQANGHASGAGSGSIRRDLQI